MSQPVEHEVYEDWAGVGGHQRYTCVSCAKRGDWQTTTALRQPYMTDAQWAQALAAFKEQHPFSEEDVKHYSGESSSS